MNTPLSGSDPHLANILGAFATTCQDGIDAACEAELGAGGGAPAALLALRTWPDSSIDALRGRVGLSHSGAVRLVDRLVTSGFVAKRPGVDGRTVALRLTSRGSGAARRIQGRRKALVSDLTDVLQPGERATLKALLQKMLLGERRTRREAQHACRLCDHTVCRGDTCPIGASVSGPE